MKCLAIYIDAPMQAWAIGRGIKERSVQSYPSKSSIMGMICAAMGIDKADTAPVLSKLNKFYMRNIVLKEGNRMHDFQAINGNSSSYPTPRYCVTGVNGKKRDSPVIIIKEYLIGAINGVILCGNDDLIEGAFCALKNPSSVIVAGRRNCLLSSSPARGVFDSKNDAEKMLSSLCVANHDEEVTIVEDTDSNCYSRSVMDVATSFRSKIFESRMISEQIVPFSCLGNDN